MWQDTGHSDESCEIGHASSFHGGSQTLLDRVHNCKILILVLEAEIFSMLLI